MENATTPTWLKESLSAVRRAPSADLQATGGLGFKRPPLELKACTKNVDSRVMIWRFRFAKQIAFDSVERAPTRSNLLLVSPNARGNFRATRYDNHKPE